MDQVPQKGLPVQAFLVYSQPAEWPRDRELEGVLERYLGW
jgi:hypothetical protein